MINWKEKKKIHDTKICKHHTKKGNVYSSREHALLEAVFNEQAPTGEPYMCRICKSWHLSKKVQEIS